MRKILYSPGYGAGWSSWMDDKIPKKFACEYQPIIEALEKGENLMGKITNKYNMNVTIEDYHPAVQQFVKECQEKFGVTYVCISGLEDLEIFQCHDDAVVRIHEYDGNESVEVGYNEYF